MATRPWDDKLMVKTDWENASMMLGTKNTGVATEIASSTFWLKLWDMPLDHSQQGTLSASTVLRTI